MIFNHILEDLHYPLTALASCDCSRAAEYKYKIHSFVKPTSYPFEGNKVDFTPADYLIMSEEYGIPQARHRVILLGIREDMMISGLKVYQNGIIESAPRRY